MVTMKKIVTVVQPEPGSVKKPFRINTSYRLGVTQILLGILCFVFHIVALAVDAAGDRAGHGLWAGAAFMITGTAAVIAAYRPTQNPITIMFFLSIVSTCLAVMMLVIAAVALSVDVDQQLCDSFGACREPVVTKESRWRTRLAMNSLLLILGIIETPLAIWSAYICGTVQIVLAATPPMPEPRVEPHPPNRPYAYNPEATGKQSNKGSTEETVTKKPHKRAAPERRGSPKPTLLEMAKTLPESNVNPAFDSSPELSDSSL